MDNCKHGLTPQTCGYCLGMVGNARGMIPPTNPTAKGWGHIAHTKALPGQGGLGYLDAENMTQHDLENSRNA